ncbi:MAG: type II toxin-antitoxin system Phd/YefM family antitoxin, partial [Acidimicrobiales bacterium]
MRAIITSRATRPPWRCARSPSRMPRGRPLQLPARSYLAILMDMSLAEHLSLADVKNRLSEVIEKLEREHGRVVVTKHGRPAAVLVSIEDLESLEETLE